jgi:hypothetical protein
MARQVLACSNSVQYVRLHPILMTMLLYHYKQLTEYFSEVEQIEAKVERLLLLAKEEKRRKTSVLSPAEASTLTSTTP